MAPCCSNAQYAGSFPPSTIHHQVHKQDRNNTVQPPTNAKHFKLCCLMKCTCSWHVDISSAAFPPTKLEMPPR